MKTELRLLPAILKLFIEPALGAITRVRPGSPQGNTTGPRMMQEESRFALKK
jgi:hypothetical protein